MGAMPAQTVTLRNIELARLGTWAASTGMVNLSGPDFADAVAAAGDPEIDEAALKFGHLDNRFDGEPAWGWLSGLRVSEDGTTLLGDIEDVPIGLSEVLPKAFRRRSVEIDWNVKTPSGKTYRMVISGLALLGAKPPAVKGLAGLVDLYQARAGRTAATAVTVGSSSALPMGDADAVDLAQARELVSRLAAQAGADPAATAAITQALEGLAGVAAPGIHHPAAAAVETVGDAATQPSEVATMPEVNAERLQALIAQGRAEDLAALEALLTKAGIPATPAPAGAPAAGATTAEGTPAGQVPPVVQPAAGQTPAGAAAAAPTVAEQAAAAGTIPTAPVGAPAAGELVGAGAAALAAGTPGTVTLSAGQWQAIEALLTTTTAERRVKAVDTALSEGRIHPTERAAYLAAIETNEAGTTALLTSLAPNKFPVSALGSSDPAATAELAAGDAAPWDDFGASIGVPGLGGAQPAATK